VGTIAGEAGKKEHYFSIFALFSALPVL